MLPQPGREFFGGGHDTLGRFARRERPDVGDQVGERDVDFVADGGDGRNPRRGDRPHDGFFVERPQVFQAAAAAADDEHIGRGLSRFASADAGDDFRRRTVALHAGRDDQHVDAAPAPPQHFEKVAHRRAGRTGDKRDPPRKRRQAALAGRIEQPFGGQLFAELAQCELERTDALRLELVDDQLVAAARRIHVEVAAAEDVEPVGQFELELRRRAAPHHGADLGQVVLEREVAVARLRPREVGDFAGDPHRRETAFEQVLDAGRELGDGERLRGGGDGGCGHVGKLNRKRRR